MAERRSPLNDFTRDRGSARTCDAETWSLLFAEARAAGVLPRVADALLPAMTDIIPHGLGDQLLASQRLADGLITDVRREMTYIDAALKPLGTRVIYLKGAAYVAAGLPPFHGRIFSDIDVLVDKSRLAEAEASLMLGGWIVQPLDEYDRRYYREWSHEVPPMLHLQRGTTIDLHHSLVMPTCRVRVAVDKMIEAAVAIPGMPTRYRLADADLVLHAASHLLLNAEFDRGLRDLWDMDLLLRHFSAGKPDFPAQVLVRASEVGLSQVAGQAFSLCRWLFSTPVPADASAEKGMVMWLLKNSIASRHPDTRSRWQGLADELLLMRELHLRLPWRLLLRHLWHKAFDGERKGLQSAA
jgi:hypothetical protein